MFEIALIIGVLLIPVALAGLPRWRALIWIVMFLLVFEGALRKWVLPGLQAQIYILKDFLLLAAYVGFLLYGPRGPRIFSSQRTLQLLIMACLAYLIIELANPTSPSFLLSLAGFKNYTLYIPLLFIVPFMFASQADIERKLRLYAMAMVPVGLLGLVQFALGPAHWLNAYVAQEEGVVTLVSQFGGGIIKARTAGTFSYISGYVTFLTAMIFLTTAIIIGAGSRLRGNLWVIILLAVCAGAIFTTGSRMGVLSMIAGVPLMLLFSMMRGHISHTIALRSILAIALITGSILYLAPDAIDAFASRTSRVTDAQSRFLSPFVQTADAFEVAPILGTGMASTHGGLVPLIMGRGSRYQWLNGHFFEIESARILQEIGPIGFLLYYALRIACIVISLRMALWFKTRLYASLAVGITGFLTIHLILYIVSSPTAGIYYWFGMGLIYAMWRLEKQAHFTNVHLNYRQSPASPLALNVSPRAPHNPSFNPGLKR